MKKGAVKYIVGGCFVAVGIVLVTIAVGIGGWGVLRSFRGIEIGPGGIYYYTDRSESTIEGDDIMDNMQVDNIKNLKVSTAYGEVMIKRDNVEDIKIETKNIAAEKFKYEVKGDTLEISYKKGLSFFSWTTNAYISITFPQSFVFDNVKIENGAGKMTLEDFELNDLKIENGAGELVIKNLKANGKADINTGAGAVRLDDITCGKLDMESGVGEMRASGIDCGDLDIDNGIGAFNFEGSIHGNVDIDNGVGEVRMTIHGSSADFGMKVDSGIGQVSVNGNSPVQYSSAKYNFKVDTGIGEVRINFTD